MWSWILPPLLLNSAVLWFSRCREIICQNVAWTAPSSQTRGECPAGEHWLYWLHLNQHSELLSSYLGGLLNSASCVVRLIKPKLFQISNKSVQQCPGIPWLCSVAAMTLSTLTLGCWICYFWYSQNTWQEHVKMGKVYLVWQFEGTVHLGGEGMAAGSWGSCSHSICTPEEEGGGESDQAHIQWSASPSKALPPEDSTTFPHGATSWEQGFEHVITGHFTFKPRHRKTECMRLEVITTTWFDFVVPHKDFSSK